MTLEQLEALEAMRDALLDAKSWNNQDIRNIDEITPDLNMLKARKKVIAQALKMFHACAGQSTE